MEATQFYFLFMFFVSVLVCFSHYYFCSNCVFKFLLVFEPSKTFRMVYGVCWFDFAEKQKLFLSVQEVCKFTGPFFWSEIFTQDLYTNCPYFPNFSEFLELHKYSKFTDFYRLFCFWLILFSLCCLLILMNLWVVSGGMNHGEVGIQ